ncbi:hypothetical protein SASPL_127051 [Salvia splendens]|uniref:GATA-type domain-containing protein n=1 Tax=Salvia splendens TaxID=180675 RepID=A0A8X8XMY8_SALSN|nr:putative GATA transcription factor 22 [Salvia splendens]KAG6414331.1 hypothetical protein SASPL_127051 [Salvia splendens]
MNLNLSPMEQVKDKEHDEQQQAFNFGLNPQIFSCSSSSSASCQIFFNPSEDHMGFYHPQLYQPKDGYYEYDRGSSSSTSYDIKNKLENGVKWMAWKNDRVAEAARIEVKKVLRPSSVETDLRSSYNCDVTIRVCSDCHTTKTPLWRSGPKGPKSLCNACGIRQRKARRAMAAAAAANCGGAPEVKAKEKTGKQRCKVGGGGSSTSTATGKKMDFEDFLSHKLAIHRVFPQDENEAAILLMALSSGLVHA